MIRGKVYAIWYQVIECRGQNLGPSLKMLRIDFMFVRFGSTIQVKGTFFIFKNAYQTR